ncbi:uncharacterized protein MYCGRDRAFT_95982 [Zymoseptoria tritici IPO323]|uniref:Uncharacterized protein n=1 Tax=Zymoseptoria tritici (strain CBS 115943 / IPO323) TaxID=336722 RepID=F9XKH3_ZYMTI|nr:uncharacterized protein MYCGRDRAFT_95982 [Zymoseptoria tritici IPO323]EGP84523.1 hypothetical protein MYCGRDRAFT_95982 [Zymoseptoria tritici IPO323]
MEERQRSRRSSYHIPGQRFRPRDMETGMDARDSSNASVAVPEPIVARLISQLRPRKLIVHHSDINDYGPTGSKTWKLDREELDAFKVDFAEESFSELCDQPLPPQLDLRNNPWAELTRDQLRQYFDFEPKRAILRGLSLSIADQPSKKGRIIYDRSGNADMTWAQALQFIEDQDPETTIMLNVAVQFPDENDPLDTIQFNDMESGVDMDADSGIRVAMGGDFVGPGEEAVLHPDFVPPVELPTAPEVDPEERQRLKEAREEHATEVHNLLHNNNRTIRNIPQPANLRRHKDDAINRKLVEDYYGRKWKYGDLPKVNDPAFEKHQSDVIDEVLLQFPTPKHAKVKDKFHEEVDPADLRALIARSKKMTPANRNEAETFLASMTSDADTDRSMSGGSGGGPPLTQADFQQTRTTSTGVGKLGKQLRLERAEGDNSIKAEAYNSGGEVDDAESLRSTAKDPFKPQLKRAGEDVSALEVETCKSGAKVDEGEEEESGWTREFNKARAKSQVLFEEQAESQRSRRNF